MWGWIYGAKCYCGCGETDEAAVAGMGLVDGVGVVVAELMDDLVDAGGVVFA